MTSNLGSSLIQENFEKFNQKVSDRFIEQTKADVFELLKRSIRPEFLNRIDEIVMFSPLSASDVSQIVSMQFDQIKQSLAESGVSIEISRKAIEWLALAGFDVLFGARPVKRALQRYVLNDLSKMILSDTISKDQTILVDLHDDHLTFKNI